MKTDKPVTPQEGIKAKHNAVHNPNPWVVVTNPGTESEDIYADFPTFSEARKVLTQTGEPTDIMKRLDNGVLTTEF